MKLYDVEDFEIGSTSRAENHFLSVKIEISRLVQRRGSPKLCSLLQKILLNVVRDSIATRVNDLGQVVLVPSNAPRFNYDPTTLTSLGLLI